MSLDAGGYVERYSPYTGAAFSVHRSIGIIANDANYNEIWMALRNLAAKSRVSLGSAKAAVDLLVRDGFLEVLDPPTNRHPGRYRFLFPEKPIVFETRADKTPEPYRKGGSLRSATEHSSVQPLNTGSVQSGETCVQSGDDKEESKEAIQKNQKQTSRPLAAERPEVTEGEGTLFPNQTPKTRPPDPLFREVFDSIAAALELDLAELTKDGRGALGKAAKDIRAVGATPADVRLRVAEWPRRYPGATLTPSALAHHWALLNPGRTPLGSKGQGANGNGPRVKHYSNADHYAAEREMAPQYGKEPTR